MRIVLDADACPGSMKRIALAVGREYNLKVVQVASIANWSLRKEGNEDIWVDSHGQETDMVIVNLVKPRDMVVTADYGFAVLVLLWGGGHFTQGFHTIPEIGSRNSSLIAALPSRLEGEGVSLRGRAGTPRRTSSCLRQASVSFSILEVSIPVSPWRDRVFFYISTLWEGKRRLTANTLLFSG